MKPSPRWLLFALPWLSVPAHAEPYQKHHFWLGLGAAQPRDQLNEYFRDTFAWGFGYGYRPLRYLQIDGGLESAIRAGRVDDFFDSPAFGPLRIRDFQYFVPFGARAVLPIAKGKAELYWGGGGAYVRYTEQLRQPSDWVRVGCPVCGARDGFGSYALAGGNIALDRNKTFRLGATVKVYRVTTEGRQVGAVPPIATTDRWVNSYLHFTISF
jgi:hypothetical protein